MKKKFFRNVVSCLLAFLIAFEPLAVPALQAMDARVEVTAAEEKEVSNDDISASSEFLREIATPQEVQNNYFELKGKTKESAEARVWSEWGYFITKAYLSLGEGAEDAFTFYDGLQLISDVAAFPKDVADAMMDIAGNTLLSASFVLAKVGNTLKKGAAGDTNQALRLCAKASANTEKLENSKFATALGFFSAPTSPEGGKAYWKWVTKDRSKTVFSKDEGMSTLEGVGRTYGIALSTVGAVLSVYKFVTNDDLHNGRLGSYSAVKAYMGLLNVVKLTAMFIPGIGQVIAVVAIVFDVFKEVGDAIGELNTRWTNAYKASFDFMLGHDPEFEAFYEERDVLTDSEKSSILINLEAKREELGGKLSEKEEKIYESLEKQGILASYYAFKDIDVEDLAIDCQVTPAELWKSKQNFMAYKPTLEEVEERESQGDFERTINAIGDFFNPMTHIKNAANWFASRDYKKKKEKYGDDLPAFAFNPDFYVMKYYREYMSRNDFDDALHYAVGLRVQQSPFNYLALADMNSKKWNEDFIRMALKADSFMVGEKELCSLADMVEIKAKETKDCIKEVSKTLRNYREWCSDYKDKCKTLGNLLKCNDPDNPYRGGDEVEDCYRDFRREFGLPKRVDGDITISSVIEAHKEDIEKIMLMAPLTYGYLAANTVILTANAKDMIDTAKLMDAYYQNRLDVFNDFDNMFNDEEFNTVFSRYLKENDFTNHERTAGRIVCDWFSGIRPSYENTKDYLNQCKKSIGKYEKTLADIAYEDYDEVLDLAHEGLKAWKGLLESVPEDLDLDVPYVDGATDENGKTYMEQVFYIYELPYERTPIDPAAEVSEDALSDGSGKGEAITYTGIGCGSDSDYDGGSSTHTSSSDATHGGSSGSFGDDDDNDEGGTTIDEDGASGSSGSFDDDDGASTGGKFGDNDNGSYNPGENPYTSGGSSDSADNSNHYAAAPGGTTVDKDGFSGSGGSFGDNDGASTGGKINGRSKDDDSDYEFDKGESEKNSQRIRAIGNKLRNINSYIMRNDMTKVQVAKAKDVMKKYANYIKVVENSVRKDLAHIGHLAEPHPTVIKKQLADINRLKAQWRSISVKLSSKLGKDTGADDDSSVISEVRNTLQDIKQKTSSVFRGIGKGIQSAADYQRRLAQINYLRTHLASLKVYVATHKGYLQRTGQYDDFMRNINNTEAEINRLKAEVEKANKEFTDRVKEKVDQGVETVKSTLRDIKEQTSEAFRKLGKGIQSVSDYNSMLGQINRLRFELLAQKSYLITHKGYLQRTGQYDNYMNNISNTESELNRLEAAVEKANKDFCNRVKEGVQSGIDKAKDAAGTVIDGIKTGVDKAKDAVGRGVDAAKDAVDRGVEKAKDVAGDIRDGVEAGIDRAKDAVDRGVEKAKDVAGNIRDGVEAGVDRAKDAVDRGVEKAKDVAGNIRDGVEAGVDKAKDVVKTGAEVVVGTVIIGAEKISEATKKTAQAVKTGFENLKDKANEAVENLHNNVEKARDVYAYSNTIDYLTAELASNKAYYATNKKALERTGNDKYVEDMISDLENQIEDLKKERKAIMMGGGTTVDKDGVSSSSGKF